jgi:hypothetical protein
MIAAGVKVGWHQLRTTQENHVHKRPSLLDSLIHPSSQRGLITCPVSSHKSPRGAFGCGDYINHQKGQRHSVCYPQRYPAPKMTNGSEAIKHLSH